MEVTLSETALLVLIFWPAAMFGVIAAIVFRRRSEMIGSNLRRFAQRVGTAALVLAVVVPILLGVFVTLAAE